MGEVSLWSRWVRDALTVLAGLGIELHEVLCRPAAPLMVAAGLVLAGKVPADQVLGRWLAGGGVPQQATTEPPATRRSARSSS